MLFAHFALAALTALAIFPSARQDEAALSSGLAGLEAHVSKADWPALRSGAQAQLEAQADQPYVWLHLPDLGATLQMVYFYDEYQAPHWKELTSGELLDYNEGSGSLKLLYKPTTLADFKKLELDRNSRGVFGNQAHLYVHPAHFHGEYSVEIRGSALQRPIDLLLTFSDAESALVSTGAQFDPTSSTRGPNRPARISMRRNGAWSEAARRDESPCRIGKPFVVRFTVGCNRLTVTYKGQLLLSTEKPSGSFGGFSLPSIGDIEEILVQGRAQTSWLQGKRDAHFEQAWQRLFASRAAYRVLPPTLRLMFPEYVNANRGDRLPGHATESVRRLAEECA